MIPAHGDNVVLVDWDAEDGAPDPDMDNRPIFYVIVTSPKDQSALHGAMGLLGYIPTRLAVGDEDELWRFHHPDGPKPL